MSIVHLRNLAKYGVLSDPDPFDLPPEAFSAGVNVRFRNGNITGGPVFRSVLHLGTSDPRYVFGSNPTSGLDLAFIGYMNGRVYKYASGAETDYSIASYTPSSVEATWTDTALATVVYVNRSDRTPWYLRTSDSQFIDLSTAGWDATWKAQLLRTCAGALVALNVTKGATSYPTMVKTSSIATSGAVPSSWDQTNPATLATENILSQLKGGIVDACSLGNDLIIYGSAQCYRMAADNSSFIYRYDPLPFKKGAINANCSVEIDGKNYVFGPDDIWVHDGVSERSICNGKTREFIFTGLNLSKASRCFVQHNPQRSEIIFAYVSGDRLVNFLTSPDGCNRQAVYNYVSDTWTFDDLPMVFSSAYVNLSNTLTYATITSTYDSVGGSYLDQEDGYKRTQVYVGSSNSTYSLSTSLYAFDWYGNGSTVAYDVDTNATKPRYLERDGIDLDELGVDLRGYKTTSSIYPQARLGSGAANLQVAVGAADYFNQTPTFSSYQSYDGASNYKLDYNVAGRWLSMRVLFSDYRELTVTGFDFDLKVTGHV